MLKIVEVPFYGDVIEAIKNERGVWVSLKRMCENVDVDYSGQAAKLKNKPWAVMEMISMTGSDGKTYRMLMLHIDSVPMWLATIDTFRVRADIRPKLVAYQKECARVLRDYFFGKSTITDVAHIVQEVSRAMVPVIIDAVSQAVKVERQATFEQRTVIGRGGAATINARLREIARLKAMGDKVLYRSYLSSFHVDLRSALNFSGTGRGWSNLPLAKWAEAKAELEKMERDAIRSCRASTKSRQEELFPSDPTVN